MYHCIGWGHMEHLATAPVRSGQAGLIAGGANGAKEIAAPRPVARVHGTWPKGYTRCGRDRVLKSSASAGARSSAGQERSYHRQEAKADMAL